MVAGDDAARLERADAPPARRRAEAHAFGEVGVREAPVGLQVGDDCGLAAAGAALLLRAPVLVVVAAATATTAALRLL